MNIKTYSYFLLIGFSLTPTYGMFGHLFGTGSNINDLPELHNLLVIPKKNDYPSFPINLYVAKLHNKIEKITQENKQLKSQLNLSNNTFISINKDIDDSKDDEKNDDTNKSYQINQPLSSIFDNQPKNGIPSSMLKQSTTDQSITKDDNKFIATDPKGLSISPDQTIWLAKGNHLLSFRPNINSRTSSKLYKETRRVIAYKDYMLLLVGKNLRIYEPTIGPICDFHILEHNKDQKKFGLSYWDHQGFNMIIYYSGGCLYSFYMNLKQMVYRRETIFRVYKTNVLQIILSDKKKVFFALCKRKKDNTVKMFDLILNKEQQILTPEFRKRIKDISPRTGDPCHESIALTPKEDWLIYLCETFIGCYHLIKETFVTIENNLSTYPLCKLMVLPNTKYFAISYNQNIELWSFAKEKIKKEGSTNIGKKIEEMIYNPHKKEFICAIASNPLDNQNKARLLFKPLKELTQNPIDYQSPKLNNNYKQEETESTIKEN